MNHNASSHRERIIRWDWCTSEISIQQNKSHLLPPVTDKHKDFSKLGFNSRSCNPAIKGNCGSRGYNAYMTAGNDRAQTANMGARSNYSCNADKPNILLYCIVRSTHSFTPLSKGKKEAKWPWGFFFFSQKLLLHWDPEKKYSSRAARLSVKPLPFTQNTTKIFSQWEWASIFHTHTNIYTYTHTYIK